MPRAAWNRLALFAALVLGGCSGGGPLDDSDVFWPDAGAGSAPDDTGCSPNECGEFECGMRDDGCGMEIDCGPCDGEDPGGDPAPSGPACEPDGYEPNDSRLETYSLGEFDESGAGTDNDLAVSGGVISAEDADWYQVSLRDSLYFQDPKMNLSFTASGDAGISIAVAIECENGDRRVDPGACDGGSMTSDGCALELDPGETGSLHVEYNCLGTTNEDAEAFLAISPACDGGGCQADACGSYSISGAVF